MNTPPRPPQTNTVTVYQFATIMALFCATSYVAFYALGLVPPELTARAQYAPDNDSQLATAVQSATLLSNLDTETTTGGELPIRVEIPSVDVAADISNPRSTSTAVLNDHLDRAAVRYPYSGRAGNGNMFLFGHSSYLPVVQNQAYKTFNGIQNLNPGDAVYIYAENYRYTYTVRSVELVDKDTELVTFGNNSTMLTLSTCNSFGQDTERYVVKADYTTKERLNKR